MEADEVPRVLVVDDDPALRTILVRMLDGIGLESEVAEDGIEGLAKLQLGFDMLIMDAEMPHMDGFDVVRRMRDNPAYRELPVLMMTALQGMGHRARAWESGVSDFIQKPFQAAELKMRVQNLLALQKARAHLVHGDQDLEKQVARRTEELRRTVRDLVRSERQAEEAHLDTLERLLRAAEYKDKDTAGHIVRIGLYSQLMARALEMAPRQVEVIRYGAPMHDIGKLGIPDAILLKPGPLTAEERTTMEAHTTIGAAMLRDSPSEYLQMGEVIALSHHEHYDGTGYPNGIAGTDIPLVGRLCAVADFFDALAMDRLYRPAVPVDDVFAMMDEQRGRHFDPELLDVFLGARDGIVKIKEEVQ